MFSTETLFVVSSRRSRYFLEDMASAAAWTATGRYHVLAIDESSDCSISLDGDDALTCLTSGLPEDTPACFHRLAGLAYVMRHDACFERAILLSEDGLIMGRGLDNWLKQQFTRDEEGRIGLLGVQCAGTYNILYRSNLPLLAQWNVPHQRWETAPPSLDDAFLGISFKAAAALVQRNWLLAPNADRWSGSPGHYISWLVQMLGFFAVGWGYGDRALPPLFVWEASLVQPPPHILSGDFLYYARLSRALGYSEVDLRDSYRRVRGETARAVAPLMPQVFAGPPA